MMSHIVHDQSNDCASYGFCMLSMTADLALEIASNAVHGVLKPLSLTSKYGTANFP